MGTMGNTNLESDLSQFWKVNNLAWNVQCDFFRSAFILTT